ncbi:MAG: DeoR/GlpR family DNA-binding transcription regulator [Sphaerochaetaceae bacterium]|nr:DeoR/GlpR family DNA-binding transcription regulator [Sphaerochaetaceae bacterium]
MFQNQRRKLILDLIKENGSCKVQTLSKTFNVTEPTIRQDLNALEKEGYIVRQHGGAYLKDDITKNINLSIQSRGHDIEKDRIGKKAASFIQNGDNLILDSGSTVSSMLKYIDKNNLTVITNAINIAMTLSENPCNNIILIGGELKLPTLSLTGPMGISMLEPLYADKLFLATGAFSAQAGLTYPSFSDLDIKRTMIKKATEVYLLADSSKIGKNLFASLGDVKINHLITDNGISEEQIESIRKTEIDLIVV